MTTLHAHAVVGPTGRHQRQVVGKVGPLWADADGHDGQSNLDVWVEVNPDDDTPEVLIYLDHIGRENVGYAMAARLDAEQLLTLAGHLREAASILGGRPTIRPAVTA